MNTILRILLSLCLPLILTAQIPRGEKPTPEEVAAIRKLIAENLKNPEWYDPALTAAALAAQEPSTALNLSGPSTSRPGRNVSLEVRLAGTGEPAGLQWTLTSPFPLSLPGPGTSATAAGKELHCSDAGTCLAVGLNINTIQPGPVAVYSVAIPSGRSPGPLTFALTDVLGANKDAVQMTIAAGPPLTIMVLAPHDLNGDGITNMADVYLMLDQVLQRSPCVDDQNGDGKCDLLDVLLVIRGAIP